ncbi:HD domain-containing protein [Butyrivibrio fibrisolvens]|jgi:metal-dependent HD superfamily phosphatase/phosphodiesterase|uniref:HD domain-containing protein n=1 Tax=Butyrivibrio fibrisolvens TaxID=831 RepID=UPI0005546E63
MQMKYKEIKDNEEVQALIAKGNENLGVLGFTDHSEIHASLVAERAAEILGSLGYKKKQIELVKVAAYMHDIGNAINRSRHAEYGAILANDLLKQKNIDIQERLTIVSAIAHHDESTGGATDVISAALIIADKTDVRRNRVRQKPKASFDVHDRVNYAVTRTDLVIDKEKKQITLNLEIDEKICTMYEYFDIFLGRMMMCRKASELLGVTFGLMVNGNKAL